LWYNEADMPKMSKQSENNLRDVTDMRDNGMQNSLSPALIQATPPSAVAIEYPLTSHSQTGQLALALVAEPQQGRDWPLLSFAGSPLMWAIGAAFLLILFTLLFLVLRRRRHLGPVPLPTPSVPSIESPDGAIYFRLDGLDEEGLIIGRGKYGVDLRIEETIPHADTVSNRHARIYYDRTCGHVVIEDLDSTNGVFINGRQAPRKNLLRDGWIIGLGQFTLRYHDGESDTGPLE
jgi:hypothetical protein